MALTDNAPSSVAVYQGILAFTSLGLYGQGEGRYFYQKALTALSTSIYKITGKKEGFQNLAASMLLNVFEVR
jgi:hypothetical protein